MKLFCLVFDACFMWQDLIYRSLHLQEADVISLAMFGSVHFFWMILVIVLLSYPSLATLDDSDMVTVVIAEGIS